MTGPLFVSYSADADSYVRHLLGYLGAAGLPARPDQEIGTGALAAATAQAIDAGAAVMMVITPGSVASDRARQVFEYASARQKPIALLLLAGAPPSWLAGRPYEDVTDGRMPGSDTIEGLRRITAPTTGAVGTATAGPVMVGAPAAAPRRRKGLLVGLIVGGVVVLALCGVGAYVGVTALAGQLASARASAGATDSPATSAPPTTTPPAAPTRSTAPAVPTGPRAVDDARFGDCLAGTTAAELDADKVEVVACSAEEAAFRVVAVVEDKLQADSQTACDPFIGTEYVYWVGREGRPGTVLCLMQVVRETVIPAPTTSGP